MIATNPTPKTAVNQKNHWSRRNQPLQVKACEIDGYGNYGCHLADELQVALPQLHHTRSIADISTEEFEAACGWFWS